MRGPRNMVGVSYWKNKLSIEYREDMCSQEDITAFVNNLRFSDDTTLMAESKDELKSLLLKVKEESEKPGLKLNIQKTRIMASGPITSWQIDGETMEIVTDFIFLGSKITVDGDCSHEVKRRLLLVMTNLNSILKSRDITLMTKVCIIKAVLFFSSHVWNARVGP